MSKQLGLFASPTAPAVPPSTSQVLRGLTLWQPWCRTITHGPKRIENRKWAPWSTVVGEYIAIHAGATLHKPSRAWLAERGYMYCDGDLFQNAIVGVARVTGFVTASTDPWFFGPFGWTLDDVRAIDPVPCKGAMGLWKVPQDIAAEVRRRAGL